MSIFNVVHSPFPLPITVSPTLQGTLKDGFGEAVAACDMPEPCKFLSLDNCQKRFLWTHEGVDLAPHPVVGLVLQVGDVEKFPQAFGFEAPDPFLSQPAGSMFHSHREGWRWQETCRAWINGKLKQNPSFKFSFWFLLPAVQKTFWDGKFLWVDSTEMEHTK